MKLTSILLLYALVLMSTLAMAQGVILPGTVDTPVDWSQLITQLIANPKALSAAAIGALVVLVIVQALKSEKLGKIFKFLEPKVQFAIITVLGQAYGIIVSVFVLKDQDISKAIIGVFASGGAAAIWNAIKLLKEKPKTVSA